MMGNELCLRDLEGLFGMGTPCIPYSGLIGGLGTVALHVWTSKGDESSKKHKVPKTEEKPNSPVPEKKDTKVEPTSKE